MSEGRCCCGKYTVSQDEDFISNETQHQLLGKKQNYGPFCGPIYRHEIAALREEVDTFRKAEKELSDAYLRIRSLVSAWDTNFGGENRYEVTENAVKSLKDRVTELEGKLAKYEAFWEYSREADKLQWLHYHWEVK